MAVDLDVAQCTKVVGAACHIQCVEDTGKGREGVGARRDDFAHDVDGHGACLSQRELDAAALVAGTEL